MAITKEVTQNGMIRVSHSQWVIIANARAAVEIKKINQASDLFFFLFADCSCAIIFFGKNRGERVKIKISSFMDTFECYGN